MRHHSPLLALLALSAAIALASAPPADASPLAGVHTYPSSKGAVALVNHRRRHHHSYRESYVEAPFTRVESRRRRVAVDAPFASVRTGKRGTRVRAPFVNLFVPR